MWKALLCLLLATATLSSAGRKRVHSRAPTFFNFRPEIVSDDEFIPLESSFPSFGLKAAIGSVAADTSDDSSGQDDQEGETKSATGPATEADDSADDSDEKDAPEHRGAPAPKPYAALKDHGNKKPGKGWDASYAFGYDLDDQSRHETSDPNGNVNGFYSFVDDEGTLRKITYTAGAGKGFVVLNKDKVKGFGGIKRPKKGSYAVVDTGSSNQDKQVYQSPPADTHGDDGDDDGGSSAGSGDISSAYPGKPWGALAIKNTGNNGKGGKRKKPIFVVKIRRPANKNFPFVNYRPRPPAYPHAHTFAPPLLPPYLPYLPYQLSLLSAPARHPGGGPRQPPYGGEDDGEWQEPAATSGIGDSSYSFGYDAGTSNRKEVADPWGNVRGSYSYIDPAGVRRTVNYIAGGSTGFKVLNASPAQIQNVYEHPPNSFVPRRHGNRRLVPVLRGAVQVPQPSAIVYHIHPDGGWKPWEPKKPRRTSRKRANPNGKDSAGSASELNNRVQVDSGTEDKIKESEAPGTILVQTHPPQEQITETTTFSTIVVSPEEHRPQRVQTHGQRSFTGDDEEASYVAYTSTPQSAEFHNDATLFDPNIFALGEPFAVAEDTRHPIPVQLATINGLNVQLRAFQNYGDKIQTSESKRLPVAQDSQSEEVVTGETTTMSSARTADSEMGGTTMSTTQVEKPRNRSEVGEDGGSAGEMTTMQPSSTSPATTSSSRKHGSKRKHGSGGSKSHAQTVQRMTREQTTKSTADIDAEVEADTQHVETISLSGRLVKRLAVPPTTSETNSTQSTK